MDPITMMVASVGIQFFTNFANNKKNKEIQAHQREFQKAVTERDFDRMRRAQAAAAQLALELEEEVHKDRLGDIEDNYNKLLQDFAHGFAISNWPLNVLPFIMKGESFGSLIGGSTNSINMHCILTPSNCDWFNEYFYDELDIRVEAEMNNHWNAQSTHPIVYYGGAWNRRDIKPSGFSIIKPIDLDDIALLKNQLNKIPMMVITPYFDPYLHFRVQLWGMGKDSENPFRIDPLQGNVNIKDRIFSYDYSKDDQPELTDDFFNTTMEEFVPYLTSLIGFVADKYFWGIYQIPPILPLYLNQSLLLKGIYKPKYLHIINGVLEDGILSLSNAQKQIEYIDSINTIITNEERTKIENSITKKINDEYLLLTNTPQLTSYHDVKAFIARQYTESQQISWVEVSAFDERFYNLIKIERFDIIELLDEFINFIDSFQNVNKSAIAIYIEEYEYKNFIFHAYNIETKTVLQSLNGFSFKVITKFPYHVNNIKAIFKHKIRNAIVCKYDRIPKLKEKIIADNLTF